MTYALCLRIKDISPMNLPSSSWPTLIFDLQDCWGQKLYMYYQLFKYTGTLVK